MACCVCPSCKRALNASVCPFCNIVTAFDEYHPNLDELECVTENEDEIRESREKQAALLQEFVDKKFLDKYELNIIIDKLRWLVIDCRKAENAARLKKTLEEAIEAAAFEQKQAPDANPYAKKIFKQE